MLRWPAAVGSWKQQDPHSPSGASLRSWPAYGPSRRLNRPEQLHDVDLERPGERTEHRNRDVRGRATFEALHVARVDPGSLGQPLLSHLGGEAELSQVGSDPAHDGKDVVRP